VASLPYEGCGKRIGHTRLARIHPHMDIGDTAFNTAKAFQWRMGLLDGVGMGIL